MHQRIADGFRGDRRDVVEERSISRGARHEGQPNKRDGQNTVGWARGSAAGRSGVTELPQQRPDPHRGVQRATCSANLYEADVRLTTTYRWTSGGGQCRVRGRARVLPERGLPPTKFGRVIGLCHACRSQPSSLMYPSLQGPVRTRTDSDETASGQKRPLLLKGSGWGERRQRQSPIDTKPPQK